MASTEFTIKDSIHFAEETVNQQLCFFIGNLDVDFLFTKIILQKTLGNCTNELLKKIEPIEGLRKSEFRELLSLASKDTYFLFDGTIYKQMDDVAMSSHLDPTQATGFEPTTT